MHEKNGTDERNLKGQSHYYIGDLKLCGETLLFYIKNLFKKINFILRRLMEAVKNLHISPLNTGKRNNRFSSHHSVQIHKISHVLIYFSKTYCYHAFSPFSKQEYIAYHHCFMALHIFL